MKLSLVLPTYEEAENLPLVLDRLEGILAELDYEILVVDDDSPDGTWQVARRRAEANPRIRVVRRITDRGLSSAVLKGFEVAKGDILGVMDADLSHDESILPRLIQSVESGADIAVGSRRVKGGGAERWPWYRRLLSTGATRLSQWILRVPLADPMSGYFVVRRSVYDKIKSRIHPRGYKILLDMAYRSQPCRIEEIPYVFRDRRQGYSKLTASVALSLLESILQLRWGVSPLDSLRRRYHTGRYRRVERRLVPGRTLDLGCGRPCESMPDGSFLGFLDRPGSAGLDIKACSLRQPFARGSVLALPFRRESFDNVVAMEILEHVDGVDHVLRDIAGTLKPGGRLVMSTPDANLVWEAIWHLWTRWVGRMWEDEHHTNLTRREWVEKMERYFRVISSERHWHFNIIITAEKLEAAAGSQRDP